MYYVPLEEQETHICFMRNDAHATIYTTDSTPITKLDKLCEAAPDYYKLVKVDTIKGEVCGKSYKIIDKSMVSFRAKKRENTITDEQREAARERMRNLRKNV